MSFGKAFRTQQSVAALCWWFECAAGGIHHSARPAAHCLRNNGQHQNRALEHWRTASSSFRQLILCNQQKQSKRGWVFAVFAVFAVCVFGGWEGGHYFVVFCFGRALTPVDSYENMAKNRFHARPSLQANPKKTSKRKAKPKKKGNKKKTKKKQSKKKQQAHRRKKKPVNEWTHKQHNKQAQKSEKE